MLRTRVIPVLLIKGEGLYKGVKFKDFKYVGDPINAVKIFNDKEVDEICILDISASVENKEPNYKLINEFASECFMPCCYGGGIRNFEQVKKIFDLGIEKVAINTGAVEVKNLIANIAKHYGSSSTVVSVDYKKNLFGKSTVYIKQGTTNTKLDVLDFAKQCEQEGAGELILNSIDRDGTMNGYDLELIQKISSQIKIPLIASGGAGNIIHLGQAVKHGASAVAAGSMFVFHGKLRGVLINFPSQEELIKEVY